MTGEQFALVGVVGAGQMGGGIAEVIARAGVDVIVSEVSEAAADAGRARILKSLDKAAERGKVAVDDLDAIAARMSFTSELADLANCDLVIEAAVEDLAIKRKLFAQLDGIVKPDAVLATNTSSIPIIEVATATTRPGHVLGMHFFNPPPVMALVEIIRSELTDEVVAQRVGDFATKLLGKTTVAAPDRPGFIVNALLIPYLVSAIRMWGDGLATAVDIDDGMRLGCGHPMGPLALADLIGLDTVKAIAELLHAEFRDPFYEPPKVLLDLVAAGKVGRKSGEGIHSY